MERPITSGCLIFWRTALIKKKKNQISTDINFNYSANECRMFRVRKRLFFTIYYYTSIVFNVSVFIAILISNHKKLRSKSLWAPFSEAVYECAFMKWVLFTRKIVRENLDEIQNFLFFFFFQRVILSFK